MKKNWLLMLGLLVVVLSVGVYGFVTGVSNQLWQASMRTIIESTHQGANALNVQFERDFEDLEQIWRQLAQAEPEAPTGRRQTSHRLFIGLAGGTACWFGAVAY